MVLFCLPFFFKSFLISPLVWRWADGVPVSYDDVLEFKEDDPDWGEPIIRTEPKWIRSDNDWMFKDADSYSSYDSNTKARCTCQKSGTFGSDFTTMTAPPITSTTTTTTTTTTPCATDGCCPCGWVQYFDESEKREYCFLFMSGVT